MMNKKKKVISLVIDENGNIEKDTFDIKKGKLYELDFESENYEIRVEDEKICELKDDLTFKFKKFGQTKIFFTNKETKEFSYITLKAKNRFIPIFIPAITIGAASITSYMLYYITEKPKDKQEDKPTEKIEEYTEKTTTDKDEVSQAVIVFPSNVTNIGVSAEKPTFAFENSKYNRVFFHYYIYNKVSATTIDVGQVAPGEVLEFDIAKHFAGGITEIRVDIRTFKDTAETKERNSMSFNGVVIKK